jgi:hypothetical protein
MHREVYWALTHDSAIKGLKHSVAGESLGAQRNKLRKTLASCYACHLGVGGPKYVPTSGYQLHSRDISCNQTTHPHTTLMGGHLAMSSDAPREFMVDL